MTENYHYIPEGDESEDKSNKEYSWNSEPLKPDEILFMDYYILLGLLDRIIKPFDPKESEDDKK